MQESIQYPTLAEWLLGQCDRQDAVGMVARLFVSQSEKIRKIGIDAWMKDLTDEGILAFAVENTTTAFQLCLDELKTTGHSRSYPIWMRDRSRVAAMKDGWAKHRLSPEVSPYTYLTHLHKGLRSYLDTCKIIYLDTCHWIRMRDAMLGNLHEGNKHYPVVLGKLRELKAQKKIICPFSAPLYFELMKQPSDLTRRAMAELMDELSEGICIQSPDQIQRFELKQQVLQSVLGDRSPCLKAWLFTKAKWIFGIQYPVPEAFSEENRKIAQKQFIDSIWMSTLSDLAEFQSDDRIVECYEAMATVYKTIAETYRQNGTSYEQVLMENKVHQLQMLVQDELPKMAKEIEDEFPKETAACIGKGAPSTKPDPAMLPSVQICAAIYAAYFLETKNKAIISNDLIDALHAGLAVPYYDIFWTEKGLAHVLTVKPRQFDKVYVKRITSNLDEFMEWLLTL